MDNLIIGNTAQLNYYFPENYSRISSRDLNFQDFKNKNFDSVYILFAEQRTFLKESEDFFIKTNVDYTLKVVDFFKQISKKVVVYSTSELWNDYEGEIDVNLKFKYNFSPYIKSKEVLSQKINENKDIYKNVHIIYPFNFNSPFRKEGFLFYKIFNSVLNKQKETIGDVDMMRDVVHPSVIVKESLTANTDKIIGSGELINIKTYIEDIFALKGLNFSDYITTNVDKNLSNIRKQYISKIKYSSYKELLDFTNDDLKKFDSKIY